MTQDEIRREYETNLAQLVEKLILDLKEIECTEIESTTAQQADSV